MRRLPVPYSSISVIVTFLKSLQIEIHSVGYVSCPNLSNSTVPIQPLQLDDHKNSISHQQWSQVIDVGTCWEFWLSLSMCTRFHKGDWEMKHGARSNLEEAAPVNGPCANMGRPGSAWVVGKWWSTAAGNLDPLSFLGCRRTKTNFKILCILVL